MRNLLASNRSIAGFLLLMLLALAGNAVRIELFLGVYFFFSSVFVLLAVYYFGTKKAVAVAAFASFYILIDSGYSLGAALLVLEAAFTGLVYRRVKSSLLWADLLFLTLVAGPCLLLADIAFLGFSWSNALVDLLKQTVNGFLNVMLANALIVGIAFFSPVKQRLSLQAVFFHLLMLFFFLPLLMFIVYISKEELTAIEKTAEAELNKTASALTVQLHNLYHSYVMPLAAIADGLDADAPEQVKEKLAFTQQTVPSFKILAITDASGKEVIRRSRYALRNESVSLQVREQRGAFLSDLPPAPAAPLLTVGVPIAENGLIQGYVAGAVSPVAFLKVIQEAAGQKVTVALLDREQHVIVSNRMHQAAGQPFVQTSGPAEASSLQEWSESVYSEMTLAGAALPWSISVSIPASEWQEQLQQAYIRLFALALISAAGALLISHRLSVWLQGSFASVAAAAHNLPEKIRRRETIDWPDVPIAEVSSIVQSFQKAETGIHELFADVRRSEQNFEYLAHYDPLTNAYSRSYFLKHFQELINKAGASKEMALFFIDLDRFKIVNDLLGHQAGDSLLIEVGQRLKTVVSDNCLIARLGGDEFLILMPDAQPQKNVEQTAKALIKALSQPYQVWGIRHHLTASIGISLYPHDGSASEALIKHADMAMYEAKNKGKDNYQFYSAAMKEKMIEKARLESELRQALEKQQLTVYYQPQIDLQTGTITGVEALLRWQHPRLGFVSPALFVPIAEETGLIVEMGEWVLQKACRDAKAWQIPGQAPINVSVNVSMKQLLHESLLPSVEAALQASGLCASCLKLEITESMAMSQPQQVIEKLNELKQLGIQLALDDFGTGYSSLNYLKMLPVNILKIDRTFVKDIEKDPNDLVIVKALVEVAHSLGMTVIAEGVETKQQQRILASIDCDQLQGFVFSKPLPCADIVRLLAGEKAI